MNIALFANTDWYLYNFTLHLASTLKSSGHNVFLISPSGPWVNEIIENGFNWIPLEMKRRSLNPFVEFFILLQFIKLLSKYKINLVHGFTIKCVVYGSISSRFTNVSACVSSVSGLGYIFTSKDFLAFLLKPVVRFFLKISLIGSTRRLILLNKDDASYFINSKLAPPSKIDVILGSGVNCTRFSPSPLATKSHSFRVLLAARLLWDKGIYEYIQASRFLLVQGRKIEFLLAGNFDHGNPSSVAESNVYKWVGEGLVKWLGQVDNMALLLKNIDVMVLPSYREGLPTVLTEAAASAVPIVASDVPGCREVVTNGENGFLVPVKNYKALADAIAFLQDNPTLCAQFGEKSRQKALSMFDERITTNATIKIYNELMSK